MYQQRRGINANPQFFCLVSVPPLSFQSLQIQQIIVIVIPSLPATHHNLLLLLVIRHGIQKILELCLRDLLAQLARLREHDEAVLDVGGTRFLDETDAAETVGGFGVENLAEGVLAGFVFLSGRECEL